MSSFYRKYRPRRIEELDLEEVRNTLAAGLKKGELAHAYLFVGPRGSGKTSAARILAKVVNCEKPTASGEPCLECDNCRAIEQGSFVDVMEIDAASHRGIDAIRELRDKIGLSPVAGRKKVYIIDEVHMLTVEAFNALLKTLEEPPEHAMFVLCTTEEHKVPETIVSRCTRVGFVKAGKDEVIKSLSKVVKGEGLKLEEGVLELLAESVDGSFREGHKLLEQLASFGKEVSLKRVEEILGSVRGGEVKQVAQLLISGKTKLVLEKLESMEKGGVDWSNFAEKLLDYVRGQLKARYGVGKVEVEAETERLRMVTMLVARACGEIKTAVVPALPLEMVAVELDKEVGVSGGSVRVVKEQKVEVSRQDGKRDETGEKNETGRDEIKADMVQVREKVSLDEVMSKWDEVIKSLSPLNHSVAGLLRSCRPKRVENHFLVIEAYYKFHKEQLEQETRRRMLEETLKREVGLPAVKFVLGERAVRAAKVMEEHDNITAPETDDKLVEAVEDVFGVEV